MVCVALFYPLAQAAPTYTTPTLKPLLQPRETAPVPRVLARPTLTGFAPGVCASAGQSLVLNGQHLGRRKGHLLVMDTGQKLITLTVSAWTTTRIKTRLPKHFKHHGKIEVGIQSAQRRWQSNPLPVLICPPAAAPVTLDAPPQSGSVIQGVEETGQAPVAPVEYGSRIGGGSLIGAALPPVPEALQIVAPDGDAQRAAPHELIAVTSSMADAKRLAQVMAGYQGRIVRRRRLVSLELVMSTFRLPAQTPVHEVLKSVHQQYPQLWIDANHYFRPMANRGGQRESLYRTIAWPSDRNCGRGVRIGLLDGPVATHHPALSGQAVVQKVLFAGGRQAAPVQHATAIASLLIGNPTVPGLGGVVPAAGLYVGVVMQQGDDDVRSTTEDLLSGLDWLLGQSVQVINLSLGGPRNALLELALQRVLARGIGVVAAAGNGGADAAPSYPAAQTGVVAVTAVDIEAKPARDASRGDYIDLAAPGVDVWVAAGQNAGRYASGTSLAAPLVAAALAQLGGKPELSVQLFRQARDLGAPGRDAVFGWGLLQYSPGLECGES